MRLGETPNCPVFYLSNRLKLVIISAGLFLYCAHLHAQNNKRPRFLRDVGGDNASSGPWQRCHRYRQCVLPGPCRVRGGGGRPSGRSRAGNQLRQRRPGVSRLRFALGSPGHSPEGHEVAAGKARAAGHQAHLRSQPVRLDAADAAQLHRRALRREQGAHGPPVRVQPRLPRRTARRDRHRLRGRTLGTTQLFRTQAQLDAAGKDIAVLERSGVPYEVLDRDGIAA